MSITIPQHSQVTEAIANIEETEWNPIGYPEDGKAQVVQTTITASASSSGGCSLVDCRGRGGCASCVVVVA